MEILAALEIKKMLVDRLVNLLSRGYVLPVVKYMAQCWRNTDTDISLIRLVSLTGYFLLLINYFLPSIKTILLSECLPLFRGFNTQIIVL